MNPTDAISRSAVLEALEAEKGRLMAQKDARWPFTTEVLVRAVDTMHEFIKRLPALDVAPVVRCEECKHYKPQNQGAHRNCTTPYCTRVCTIKVSPDDFCSRGERKGGESHD